MLNRPNVRPTPTGFTFTTHQVNLLAEIMQSAPYSVASRALQVLGQGSPVFAPPAEPEAQPEG